MEGEMTLEKLAVMVANGFTETNGRIDALDAKLSARIDSVAKEVLRHGEILDDMQTTLRLHTATFVDFDERLMKLEAC
jgi:hypothetical protein